MKTNYFLSYFLSLSPLFGHEKPQIEIINLRSFNLTQQAWRSYRFPTFEKIKIKKQTKFLFFFFSFCKQTHSYLGKPLPLLSSMIFSLFRRKTHRTQPKKSISNA
jgi:hypothetical protein